MIYFQKMIGLRWIPSCAPRLLSILRIFAISIYQKDATIKRSHLQSAYCSFKRYVNLKNYLSVHWLYSYPSEPH